MTNMMTYPTRKQTAIRVLPQPTRAQREAYRRARRRRAMWNTVLEALSTFAIIACMILCATAFLCLI